MADVTIARAPREEMRTLPAEAPAGAEGQSFRALPRLILVLWAGLVLATVALLAVGTLRVGAGNWIGRRMPIRLIWSRFLEFLTDLGAPGPLVFLVTAAAVVAMILSAVSLWLAFALRDGPPEPEVETAARV